MTIITEQIFAFSGMGQLFQTGLNDVDVNPVMGYFVVFAAWLGLTPKNHSTAGKNRLGVITRAGDGMLRTVLVAGATAVIADMRRRGSRPWSWLKDMIARKPPKLVAIALANKLARIAWKLMVSGERYRPASPVLIPTPT